MSSMAFANARRRSWRKNRISARTGKPRATGAGTSGARAVRIGLREARFTSGLLRRSAPPLGAGGGDKPPASGLNRSGAPQSLSRHATRERRERHFLDRNRSWPYTYSDVRNLFRARVPRPGESGRGCLKCRDLQPPGEPGRRTVFPYLIGRSPLKSPDSEK